AGCTVVTHPMCCHCQGEGVVSAEVNALKIAAGRRGSLVKGGYDAPFYTGNRAGRSIRCFVLRHTRGSQNRGFCRNGSNRQQNTADRQERPCAYGSCCSGRSTFAESMGSHLKTQHSRTTRRQSLLGF